MILSEKEINFVFFDEDGKTTNSIDVDILAENSKFDGKVSMKVGTEEMTAVEFLKEDNIVAFRIPDVDEEFVAKYKFLT